MIVVDTSALIAIIKDEEMGWACSNIMAREPRIIMSAGTLVEARIVALGARRLSTLDEIIAGSIAEVIPVTDERARFVSDVYWRWGKGFHRAGLNFGDCFAYATAKEFDCPLLYIGNDFAQTDVRSALPPSSS
ncbi:VapC toxin family PIN domain ribonuclease [Neorhizobium sp. SOG26]|uniref:type II toxin-antitoxin system VapC family toxin n=1 Tax=Neorhizobium sp. SOG26 TaxID=2060726 RepID=UPI000E573E47|nr:type II toxin-antitoxin system VapC family toxin [Neorhizobium sp. SOG26]AXV16228.1 VapC toxin family PIN domain ribonuclease [Neorhizobium sp. SOG26]